MVKMVGRASSVIDTNPIGHGIMLPLIEIAPTGEIKTVELRNGPAVMINSWKYNIQHLWLSTIEGI